MNESPRVPRTVVGYSDVHQAYQLALAAQEAGALEQFYCSIFHRSGRIGKWLPSKLRGTANRYIAGIPSEKISEYPVPFLVNALYERASRTMGRRGTLFRWRNTALDRHVSRRLPRENAELFIGVEECAEASFAVARSLGMKTVLDCPHPPHELLYRLCAESAKELGLRANMGLPSAPDHEQVLRERSMADVVLALSPVQRNEIIRSGYPAERIHVIPLWADAKIFGAKPKEARRGPLRVLFVGQISLHKGVPYLLKAVAGFGPAVELTLAGGLTPSSDVILNSSTTRFKYVGPQTKLSLAKLYQDHDLMIMPSLCEPFGFVAMEAMACGTAVVVTENAGVPVPSNEWRVPVRDGPALAARLAHYERNRKAVISDGHIAAEFAAQFTPQRYRAAIRTILAKFSGNGMD